MFLAVLTLMLTTLAACGNSAVTTADLPVYPNANPLETGQSTIADTLAQNGQQDAAMRQALGGLGGSVEQKGFQLPADATWDQVKGFYDKALADAGWSSGMGGIAGGLVDVNAMMGAANQGNELFQTGLWSKGKQTVTVIMLTDPTDANNKNLILSLASQ